MRIFFILLASLMATQIAMAMGMESKPCGDIAKACVKAGYLKKSDDGKSFWLSCMKPVILGQSVKGIKVDATTVSSCRSDKITQLKQDLNDFESVPR